MENVIVLVIVAVILGSAILYIHRQKKKGAKCIGCPDSGTCSGKCAGCSGNCTGCSGNADR